MAPASEPEPAKPAGQELAQALAQAMSTQSPASDPAKSAAAEPVGWRDRLRKTLWLDRRRQAITVSAAVLLLAGGSYGLWSSLSKSTPAKAPLPEGTPHAKGVVMPASVAPAPALPTSAMTPAQLQAAADTAAKAASAAASAAAVASAPASAAMPASAPVSLPATAMAPASKPAAIASASAMPAAMSARKASLPVSAKPSSAQAPTRPASPDHEAAAAKPVKPSPPPVPDEAFRFDPQLVLNSVATLAQVASVRTGDPRCPLQFLVVYTSPKAQWRPKTSELFGNCAEPTRIDQGEDEIVMRFAPAAGRAASVVRITPVTVHANGKRLSLESAPVVRH